MLQKFKEIISRRTGLLVRDKDSELFIRTITARGKSHGFSSSEEYLQFLSDDTLEGRQEWLELISILTTGETYFFRDKGQFAVIENCLLPELIKKRLQQKRLRIWSAGCSTGEEPYSIAILIDEIRNTNYELRKWDILILGTDINPKALERSKRGVYGDWSFRMVDPEIQKRYFKKDSDRRLLDERIKKMVKFKQINLIEDAFPDYTSEMHDIDLVICRNVFIYFNPEAVSAIVRKFTDTLNEGGFLMTGHGELYGQSLGFLRQRMFPESVVYQKSSEFGVRSREFKEIERQQRIAEPEEVIPLPITEPYILTISDFRESAIRNLKSAMDRGEYNTVIEKAKDIIKDNPGDFDALYLTAQAYANMGRYEHASRYCRKAIEIDATAEKIYFLLAHIAEETGNNEEAKDLLKKVIYLSPDFVPAYIELGALYEIENDNVRAGKMRNTAMRLLEKLPPETLVEQYSGTTAGELLDYLKKRK